MVFDHASAVGSSKRSTGSSRSVDWYDNTATGESRYQFLSLSNRTPGAKYVREVVNGELWAAIVIVG